MNTETAADRVPHILISELEGY